MTEVLIRSHVSDSVSVDILEKCSLFVLSVHVYRLVVTVSNKNV